jgi:hypothetical protein
MAGIAREILFFKASLKKQLVVFYRDFPLAEQTVLYHIYKIQKQRQLIMNGTWGKIPQTCFFKHLPCN